MIVTVTQVWANVRAASDFANLPPAVHVPAIVALAPATGAKDLPSKLPSISSAAFTWPDAGHVHSKSIATRAAVALVLVPLITALIFRQWITDKVLQAAM
jgi:hypothetical protein